MYNWTKELKLFNRVLTFDKCDSEKYGIIYKPNFFLGISAGTPNQAEYDLFFAGKYNPDRLSIIDRIMAKSENADINYCINVWPSYKIFWHNRLVYVFLKWINYKSRWIHDYLLNYEAVEGMLKRKYLVNNSLGYEETNLFLIKTNVVLDLPCRGQSGYSHRLIAALANGKKILTTNSDIQEESFYNPDQIRILDTADPKIDYVWIKERPDFPVSSMIRNLELPIWLKNLYENILI